MRIKDILRKKGHQVITIEPHQTVQVLVHRLALEKIGAMVVGGSRTPAHPGVRARRAGGASHYGAPPRHHRCSAPWGAAREPQPRLARATLQLLCAPVELACRAIR